MNYLSVCSGIEAATIAWHDLGWNPLGFSEIEKFPSEVLAYHYPNTPNLGDMTKYKEWDFGTNRLDLLVGGTPCQSFSVAGLRKGLDDPRGNLALTYVGILDKFRPKWCVWENVPGVLSSNRGRDFGAFLGALAELGYGFAYRVLDAQYFGVPQRRRRVFVVGCFGNWELAAKVLFESESLHRNIKKGRSKKQEATDNLASSIGALCARDYKGIGNQYVSEGKCIVEQKPLYVPDIANCLQTTCDDYSRADGFNMIAQPTISFDERNIQFFSNQNYTTCPTLTATDNKGAKAVCYENHGTDSRVKEIAISPTVTARWGTGGNNVPLAMGSSEISGTLRANPGSGWRSNGTPVEAVAIQNMSVRRLTEVECERLQGFPDNYTNIKENCPSGARYKALGNSMAVPVMKWIGERIANV